MQPACNSDSDDSLSPGNLKRRYGRVRRKLSTSTDLVHLRDVIDRSEQSKVNDQDPVTLLERLPTLDRSLPCGSLETPKKEVADVARTFVDLWDDSSDLTVETYSGGITNQLFCVRGPGVSNEESLLVLVRVYGENTEDFIDRDTEHLVMVTLNLYGLYPRLYGKFTNGCVYGRVPGRVLQADELREPKKACEIARALAVVHKLNVPLPKRPVVYETIFKWIDIVGDVDDLEKYNFSIDWFKQETEFLQHRLAALNSPIVFCHNDLLCGNIIMNTNTCQVSFIDFEYAGYNSRGFDLGNHFNEYAGFDVDWSLFPNEERMQWFISHYLETYLGRLPTEREVTHLCQEALAYSLVSHLFWGLWALMQAKESSIDFDFFNYSIKRLQRYCDTKSSFLTF